MDLPIEDGDLPSYVSLPEGTQEQTQQNMGILMNHEIQNQ